MAPPNALLEALETGFGKIERKEIYPEPPSTFVTSSGCIVQKGFAIPGRTLSSQSARPSMSTYKPIIGFPRPTGSLYDAPELQSILRKTQGRGFHRPTKSAGDLDHMKTRNKKPDLGERRQTWQSGAASSVWTADELAAPACKTSQAHLNRMAPPALPHLDQTRHMRRSHTVQGRLSTQGDERSRKDSTMRQGHTDNKSDLKVKDDIKLVSEADAEDAIASDSEDDEIPPDTSTKLRQAFQQKRVSYAERRAAQDERAAEEYDRRVAEYDARGEQEVPQRIKLMTPEQHESAIADSDSEGEDDHIAKALRTASLHSAKNKFATSLSAAELQLHGPGSKGAEHRASLSVKIESDPTDTLTVQGTNKRGDVTPREIKSFEPGAPLPCRKLRPSASRPKPAKSVLKKSGSISESSSSSESPSKHVNTVKSQTFTSKCKDALRTSACMALTNIQTYWQVPRTTQQQEQSPEQWQQSEQQQVSEQKQSGQKQSGQKQSEEQQSEQKLSGQIEQRSLQ
ncbi:hypothetical protein PRZ48_000939 [Zasmidium cellare]|uniref:Uncharacterized protein n=1 Tax=Zasmidium cellare TaxID=395010 RepID=A0ABR0EZV0_ZASCE|nr:hypothetical protein PRZ48_000939 [Zasmidium cellare]